MGSGRGELPPPALECLLESSVGQGRDGFTPATGHLQNFNPELCGWSRGDRISLLILEHFLLAHPKPGLYIHSIYSIYWLLNDTPPTMGSEYGLLQPTAHRLHCPGRHLGWTELNHVLNELYSHLGGTAIGCGNYAWPCVFLYIHVWMGLGMTELVC